MEKLFSNEIVFRGHPDKVCDQISGALLDALIEQDPDTRAGIEVMGGKSAVYIAGEITSSAQVDFIAITKRVLEDCGYDSEKLNIVVDISKQSADIALGVDKQGAGDNGMMFGYACNDTLEMLPPAVVILQQFAEEYDELRKRDSRFKSDGKAQITGVYRRDMELAEIKTFTICYQNTEEDREEMDSLLQNYARGIARNVAHVEIQEFLMNPTGRFEVGGFEADVGITGRKIVVDTYQGFARVGGGNLNGKDASKVDFSGAHYARQLAKNYISLEGLHWCEVQIAYAIGKEEPLSIYIDSDKGVIEAREEDFEEGRVEKIREKYKQEKFEELAKFGHFTR